jgi:4-nitrophenyl phosphatase
VWVIDLDGVVWLGDEPIPGAADAVARLRALGQRVVFATNNSFARLEEHESKLEHFGIPATGDVVTSAMAAAQLVDPGERVLVCGGPGVAEAAQRRGAEVVTAGSEVDALRDSAGNPAGSLDRVDVVLAGFHRDFDYERLRVAAQAVMQGARLIATNDDATYPTPHGPIPGGGAIVAAISYAADVAPIVAGKPHTPMADLIRAQETGQGDGGEAPGPTEGVVARVEPTAESDDSAVSTVVVGDRPETDGALAVALGYRYALVLSGVTSAEDLPVEPSPDMVAADLASLVDAAYGRARSRPRLRRSR